MNNANMGKFERYLTFWVTISIGIGVALGNLIPGLFSQIAAIKYGQVNLIIAILMWLMIYPMMLQIDFYSLRNIGKKPKGLILTVAINWLIKPITMAFLGWLFFKILFANWVDSESAQSYIAGMILLGVAPCTAMVFVWSQMTKGDPNYTLVQVSLNDIIMIFAYAPICAFLLGITEIEIPWETLLLSIALYVILPLIAGVITRRQLDSTNHHQPLNSLISKLKPWSMMGLLATIILLFGFQGQTLLSQPMIIALIAIPILIQAYGIFALAYFAARKLQLPHNIAAPASMIGTSNFFELAVAVAIALFGLHSGAALATVVGVLVEVPVMLSLVWFANRTRY